MLPQRKLPESVEGPSANTSPLRVTTSPLTESVWFVTRILIETGVLR